jgi:2-methylcitrate dehydratase
MNGAPNGLLTKTLASYAHRLSFKKLPSEVVHEVKRRIVDSLGCAYGAVTAPPCRMARRLAEDVPVPKGASVWGTEVRTTPELAAFANGTLVRYLDCNDTYLSKEPAHPSDNIPACLAVGETCHASGRSVILAIAIAYELQCRLCDAAALRPLGWDHVTYGAFSTALATAKLLKLSPEAMAQALSIAGVTSGALRQTRVGEVSAWKACAFAHAGKNGVFATLAAQRGITGPLDVFEGEKGFMRIISGPFSLPSLGGDRGTPFKILGTYIKPYPVEYHAQSAVEAAMKIRHMIVEAEGHFVMSQIKSVVVESFDVAIEIIGRDPEKWRPKTRETADHSLPYCVAVALSDGRVNPSSFSSKRLADKTLRKLVQKVKVVEQPDFTNWYPEAMPNRLRVTTMKGKNYVVQVDHPLGHPKRPMSDSEVEGKFHRFADRRIGAYQANRLIERVWELEKITDVSMLMQMFPVATNMRVA